MILANSSTLSSKAPVVAGKCTVERPAVTRTAIPLMSSFVFAVCVCFAGSDTYKAVVTWVHSPVCASAWPSGNSNKPVIGRSMAAANDVIDRFDSASALSLQKL